MAHYHLQNACNNIVFLCVFLQFSSYAFHMGLYIVVGKFPTQQWGNPVYVEVHMGKCLTPVYMIN